MGSVVNVSIGLTQAQIDALANLLYPETPIGAVDGVNTVFLTTYSYQTERVYLYKNGQQLISPADFTESDDKEMTLTFAPQTGDVMFVQYIRTDLNP
jgi:hypothetical protein